MEEAPTGLGPCEGRKGGQAPCRACDWARIYDESAVDGFFAFYIATWSLACVLAWLLFVTNQAGYSLASPSYLSFLLQPWKMLTFTLAFLGIVFLAPYAGVPSWDYVNAGLLAALTFVTAPWVLGTLYKAIRGWASLEQEYVAFCLWMFSTSWSYDAYLLLRDGSYPSTWLINAGTSSVLYASAGLFWNLDYREGRGVTFAFLEPEWFAPSSFQDFQKAFWYALPLMLLVTAALLSFLWTGQP